MSSIQCHLQKESFPLRITFSQTSRKYDGMVSFIRTFTRKPTNELTTTTF